MMRHAAVRRVGLIGAVAALIVTAAACDPTPPPPLPVVYNVTAAAPYVLQPNKAPAGSNDPNCRSTKHPNPVILVPGTFATMGENYAVLSPLLKNNGYCVFTFNYGKTAFTDATFGNIPSVGPIAQSAQELKDFVNQVRSTTGAAKVDIVGHSQGGMMPNYYIKFLGGSTVVNHLVGLAPSNHGTDLLGLVNFGYTLGTVWPGLMPFINGALVTGGLPAMVDQEVGSAFMQKMATKPDTVAGVKYTVIATKYDEVVTPYQSQFLTGPNVTNITLQDKCVLDSSDHIAIAFDHIALQYVLNALDPSTAKTPICSVVLPGVGG